MIRISRAQLAHTYRSIVGEKHRVYRTRSTILGEYTYMIPSDSRYYPIFVNDVNNGEIEPVGVC